MPRKQRPDPTKSRKKQTKALLPEPHTYLYTHQASEDGTQVRMVSTLLHIGEALARPLGEATLPWPLQYAYSEESERVEVQPILEGLPALCDQIRAWGEEGQRPELMAQLVSAFGDGQSLQLLFQGLFPSSVARPALDLDGKGVLTSREVAVLTIAAEDCSQEEIAARLGVSEATVRSHFKHIYKKLGVQRPLQAVARAISMDYLTLDALELLKKLARCNPRDFGRFNTLVSCMAGLDSLSKLAPLQSLVEFALFLLTVSGLAAMLAHEEQRCRSHVRRLVYEINAKGDILRCIGQESLHYTRAVAIAPPHAAMEGFPPGHLFVADDALPQQGLNLSAILEFTQEGEFVRAFCGGPEVETRLLGVPSLAFTARGQLLVASGWLTDGLLAFRQGGASVRRWADGNFGQVCATPSGQIYAAQASGVGSVIKVFDGEGTLLQTLGNSPVGHRYAGLAVNSYGHVFVSGLNAEEFYLAKYDAYGTQLRSFVVPGYGGGKLAIDSLDRLYVPCEQTADIKIYSPEGRLVDRIDLQGKVLPYSLCLTDSDSFYLVGTPA